MGAGGVVGGERHPFNVPHSLVPSQSMVTRRIQQTCFFILWLGVLCWEDVLLMTFCAMCVCVDVM